MLWNLKVPKKWDNNISHFIPNMIVQHHLKMVSDKIRSFRTKYFQIKCLKKKKKTKQKTSFRVLSKGHSRLVEYCALDVPVRSLIITFLEDTSWNSSFLFIYFVISLSIYLFIYLFINYLLIYLLLFFFLLESSCILYPNTCHECVDNIGLFSLCRDIILTVWGRTIFTVNIWTP